MACANCVFQQPDNNCTYPPCNSCDGTDRGYCLASCSAHGYRPVISYIFDEGRARHLIAHAASNGTALILLCWSTEKEAYLPIAL